jgi:hypothetical protein
MRIAGLRGSSALPPAADVTKEGKFDAPFTSISNRGSIGLAKTEVGGAAEASASK